jgi:hypothetical protein
MLGIWFMLNGGGRIESQRMYYCGIPRVDDCIAISSVRTTPTWLRPDGKPGTYYLTKGWIEVSDTRLPSTNACLNAMVRYGRALRMIKLMLKNYTRLAFMTPGIYDQERYRRIRLLEAKQFDLRYENCPVPGRLLQ